MDYRQTGAFENAFFAASRNGDCVSSPETIVLEWFPVTQAFCQGICKYLGVFLSAIQAGPPSRRDRLEEAFLVPLQIASEEFGSGQHGVSGIHYRMFARLGEPLGIDPQALMAHPRGSLAATARLVDGIGNAFGELYIGASCIRVVEGTAYNIVEAMDHVFRRLETRDGRPMYSEDQLEYVTLHLEIEKEHDSMSSNFIDMLCDAPGLMDRVNEGVGLMSRLFADYWEAMADAVFQADKKVQVLR